MKKPGWVFITFLQVPVGGSPSCPAELTSSVVLVIIDEERDGIKHILFSHIVSLGIVIRFFNVIVLYTGVVLT